MPVEQGQLFLHSQIIDDCFPESENVPQLFEVLEKSMGTVYFAPVGVDPDGERVVRTFANRCCRERTLQEMQFVDKNFETEYLDRLRKLQSDEARS